MAVWEYVRMAWETLRGNGLRSVLTLVGMVVGVFAVIAAVTAVQVVDLYFRDAFNVLSANTFSVSKWPAMQMGPTDASIRNRKDITFDHLEELKRRVRLAAAVSPDETFVVTSVRYGGEETSANVRVRGTDEAWAVNNGFDVAEGRFLTPDDVRYARPVAVLGAPIAETLFPNETPLGKEVRIEGRRYRVVGVLEEKGAILGDSQDDIVMAPYTRLIAVYGAEGRGIAIDVRAPSAALLEETMDEVTSQLRIIREVPPAADNDFEIITNDALLGPVQAFTGMLTAGGAGIGLIALLAAGIGIMNIMLVSVAERTREIGIRKALGARRRDILGQFLIEAVFLCQVGGLFGIALGVLAGNYAAVFFDIEPTFPWGWAITGVLGVTAIALAFGVYPAYKAASLDPIESLRYE